MKAKFSENKQMVLVDGEMFEFVRATYNETRKTWSFVFKKLKTDEEVEFNTNKEEEVHAWVYQS